MNILVINAGSSSLKYQLIDVVTEKVLAKGLCERVGSRDSFHKHGVDKREVVIDTYGKRYWGRQGTGQSIILDSVIEQIAYDLEILEGQPNSWEGRLA